MLLLLMSATPLLLTPLEHLVKEAKVGIGP
jgi:hypothetical protein